MRIIDGTSKEISVICNYKVFAKKEYIYKTLRDMQNYKIMQ
jgi:hypothetical protein